MRLTREEALRLHRAMWSDMQKELGDNPNSVERIKFKRKWCMKHFPGEKIEASCFLCEYSNDCDRCPIKWDVDYDNANCKGFVVNYLYSPISEILALPEREVEDDRHISSDAVKAILNKYGLPYHIYPKMWNEINALPSAEEESFEWCTDCKEYDQEQHCCHRFSKIINQTVEEVRGTTAIGEWVKVHGFATPGGDPVWRCSNCGKGIHVFGVEHHSYGADIADNQWVACPNCGAIMIGERDG